MGITLADTLSGLARQMVAYLTSQQTAPGRFDTGAIIRSDWSIDDPGGSASLVALCLWTHLLRLRYPTLVPNVPDEATLANRAALALDYLDRVQRPSGLTDLRDCNYDSSPDAGFILQAICPPLLLAQESSLSGEWVTITARLREFARRMTVGACMGGFHTPNHRWVISGGLHLAGKLFPDMLVRKTIDAYLAEGIDLDADGFYIERSAGVYDAICARALLLLAADSEFRYLLEAVVRNLKANQYLLNADGTVETGLSRRQDAGTVPLASGLAVPYLRAYQLSAEAEERATFLSLARFLWDTTPPDRRDYYGMSQVLQESDAQEEVTGTLPQNITHHFPHNGLWRHRSGSQSVSVFRDVPRVLNFRQGQAYLAGVSIHQSYFGVGQFIPEEMVVTENGVTLSTAGRHKPYRPGYEQPLGRPVSPECYMDIRAEREIRRVPPAASILAIEKEEGGLSLHFQTTDGLDRATVQIAFDFPAGGVWETDDTCFQPQGGQVIFLKSSYGTMRYGNEAIRLGPGADAHRMWQMRDANPAAPGMVRVLITFLTPVDHRFRIKGLEDLSSISS